MKNPLAIRLLISFALFSGSIHAQTVRFNQSWWHSINDVEREGFFWGYVDSPCAPPIYSSFDDAQKFLETYLPKHPSVTIPVALQIAGKKMKRTKPLPGGEVYREAHGFMDGDWWGDSTHGDASEKTAYVEGYLACKHQPVSMSDVESYVRAISKYYDSKSQAMKIAYVLQPLIDRNATR